MEVFLHPTTTLMDSQGGKKVLMIAPEPYFEPRGTPISILQRLRALSTLGYQVDLLTYPFGRDIQFPGLTIYRIPSPPFIHEVKIGPSNAKLILDLLLIFRAVLLLSTRRYDVIHSHEEASFFAMVLGWLFRVPHLYDMHSSLPNQLTNYRYGRIWPLVKVFGLFERAVLKSAAAVITIDTDLEHYVRNINPAINQMQIDNLPVEDTKRPADPTELEALRNKLSLNGRSLVVYTGTLETYQGLDLLIRSAPEVRQRVPQVAYVIVGGRERQVEHYKALTRDTGVEDLFVFTGNVLPDEATVYLALADVLVSMRQGRTSVPLKIYSYLCAGKPILATRTQAHLGVLNDDLALLVEPDADDFAQGTYQLISDKKLQERLVNNSINFVSTMPKDTEYINKVRQIYSTLAVPVRRNVKVLRKT